MTQSNQTLADLQRASAQVQALLDVSTSISNWALLLLGGMLVVFLSTSYRKPTGGARLLFLIPIPALVILVAVLHYGSQIQRNRAALLIIKPGVIDPRDVVDLANSSLAQQISLFQLAIVVLAVWLAAYLVWWIFFDSSEGESVKGASL